MRPLVIDLFCGLGGWTKGFLSEGWQSIGFDIERHDYGRGGYPGALVLQDVLTIHGSQFREASCIVASPPCQRYSYMAMPWRKAKALIAWHKESPERVKDLNVLFDACFRIQIEASKAAGRYIPLVVENVKGAQPWVGRAKAHYGSYYLWGDVEDVGGRIVARGPLRFSMPSVRALRSVSKNGGGGSWWPISHGVDSGEMYGTNPVRGTAVSEGLKVPGMNFHDHEKGLPGRSFQSAAVASTGAKVGGDGKNSDSRKAASAAIAEIPFELASHIARVFYPAGVR